MGTSADTCGVLGRRLIHCVLAAALACTGVLAQAAPKTGGDGVDKGYDHYLVGSSADAAPSSPPAAPASVLMGGGKDVADALKWMIGKGGGGDFVVLRASGTDGYNSYIYKMGGLDSVETLVVRTREAAGDAFVLDRVRKAEAVFIAGGDQSDYIRLWKGTPLASALQDLVARNVPIGGTSAGLAVLGEFDFSGANGTVLSSEVLANPYDPLVTLDRGFLAAHGLGGVIADSHFAARDRMGRLLGFVARLVKDRWVRTDAARGIGVDSETALLIDNGVATRVGKGSAYFLRPALAPQVCELGKPLTFRNVQVERLSAGGSFDLRTWAGSDGATAGYDVSAEAGVLTSGQQGGSAY
ncbi:cyanophycinase [Caldimonas tepidiphila]|uniref:cyanophycinase n=1 Tax=Caldimonas tepidiphila TaxID=2315841 RepID=UPI000E5A3783|nr:cyanophycinase [Caldimonas tepidiphila]